MVAGPSGVARGPRRRRGDGTKHRLGNPCLIVALNYGAAIPQGVLVADDSAVREIMEALQIAESFGDDYTLAMGKHMLGFALAHRDDLG